MRRSFVMLLSLLLVVGSAFPAAAAKPTKGAEEWRSADAVWTTVTQTGRNTYTETWTWVYAYEDAWGGGVWVEQDSMRCRTGGKREDRCTYDGYTGYWGEGGVEVASDLSGARVVTTVRSEGRNPRELALDVTWTGTGSIFKSRGSWSGGDDCFSYRSTYRSRSRSATAVGNLGTVDLGTSQWGSLGEGAARYSYRDTCEYPEG
jgi:hypothetical protein